MAILVVFMLTSFDKQCGRTLELTSGYITFAFEAASPGPLHASPVLAFHLSSLFFCGHTARINTRRPSEAGERGRAGGREGRSTAARA